LLFIFYSLIFDQFKINNNIFAVAATPDLYKQPLHYPLTPATPREENKSRRMVGSIIFHNFVVVASFFFNCFFDLF
jgi:hypothetical protein